MDFAGASNGLLPWPTRWGWKKKRGRLKVAGLFFGGLVFHGIFRVSPNI